MWLRESLVTQEMTLIQRFFPAQLGRLWLSSKPGGDRDGAWPSPHTALAARRMHPALGMGTRSLSRRATKAFLPA